MVLSLMMVGPGNHLAAWRDPAAPSHLYGFDDVARTARCAERAFYDMLFVSDGLYMQIDGPEAGRTYPRYPFSNFEPISLLSALSSVTSRIGLGGTLSTTYSNPFSVARSIASLDHLSGGRAAWNVVTSLTDMEARNFGAGKLLQHDDRYARAAEFVDVVKQLWDSWEDDAVVLDKEEGIAFDPRKIHSIDYHSARFDIAGPLNCSRSPQGHPVIIQAGASEAGQEMAAASADVIFTAQNSLASAQSFYKGFKDRLPRFGRSAGDVQILPGLFPVVGRSDAEARDKLNHLQDLLHPDAGRVTLSRALDVDLTGVDFDKPLPELETNASKSRYELFLRISREEGLTVRDLCARIAKGQGHVGLTGTAEFVADQMIQWVDQGGADGFNLLPPTVPAGLDDFNDMVLPILRERGYARDSYDGVTLRDHLGLSRVANPR